MSQLKVARYDKRIISHLGSGGSLDDERGNWFVNELVSEALKHKTVATTASTHFLSQADLVMIYKAAFEATQPYCAMMHGALPILVPSLIFLDTATFPAMIGAICKSATPFGEASSKYERLNDGAAAVGRELSMAAIEAGKDISLEEALKMIPNDLADRPVTSGCAGVIALMLLISLATALVAAAIR